MTDRKKQRGAALLIVLLLAATVSFVAVSAMEKTKLAFSRTINVTARGEALWGAFGIETLALAAVEEILGQENATMSLDDPWATAPVELPLERGSARVFFADATTCFNVNSLGGAYDDRNAQNGPVAEFIRLAGHAGVGEFDARALAESIGDWIDEDTSRRPQGAEDGYYTLLPSPYRTGNQKLASISELRAIKGVTREIYGALKPYLCAGSDEAAMKINVNMLTEARAPVLAAALGPEVTVQAARDIISDRPPGGYAAVQEFMGVPAVAALNLSGSDRFDVTSRYLQARAEIVYDTALLEMTSMIETGGRGARVLARRIGAEE
ncbi:type II secretion system minor pseudopilin GspK [Hyphococcus luteus]|uniref:Type II secretion system protein K n=1 Tax=Hyphococcus luteus TaxID=2058213 RepID=A0A2S7K2T8_9PROT|nr:type II secretion system minor pseudopilin GspK [Marinicaulis flavus]PQA86801.1 hypothetical protein CW354_15060 [Marinicaulis flavus]